MKIINTLSVLFFLLVAVACSSESDTIMNDIDREVESSTERVAIFNVSFMSDATQTKSSGAEDVEGGIEAIGSEASISNCFIAVLNEKDEVVASSFYYGDSFTQSDNTTTIKDRMIVKVSADELPALRFLAVTNLYSFLDGYQGTSKNLLLSCKKLQEIKDFVKELRGLSQEELAKKENELKKELFDLRFQAAAGQLDQTARLNEVKKQIARVKTVQSEKK